MGDTAKDELPVYLPANTYQPARKGTKAFLGPVSGSDFIAEEALFSHVSNNEFQTIERHIGNRSNVVLMLENDPHGETHRVHMGRVVSADTSSAADKVFPVSTSSAGKTGGYKVEIDMIYDVQNERIIPLQQPISVPLQKSPSGESYFVPQSALDKFLDEVDSRGKNSEIVLAAEQATKSSPAISIVHSTPDTETLTTGGLTPTAVSAAEALRKSGVGGPK